MILLSIIIPVYNNISRDIMRCIQSLQKGRGYADDYEIVLVDDGSEDSCAKYLDVISQDNKSIRVFHQKNGGVSNARNTGVRKAKGKYVAFVDADDLVTANFMSDAIWVVKNMDLDIVYGYVHYLSNIQQNGFNNKNLYNNREEITCLQLSQKEQQELYYHFIDLSRTTFWRGEDYISRGPVARIVNKELAEQNPFVETLSIGEDAVWNLELLTKTNRIGLIERTWYYYIKNNLSATQYLSKHSIKQYSDMLQYTLKYANDDTAKACLLNKTISAGCELATGYYFTERYSGNLFTAASEFNRMFSCFPWNAVLCSYYAKQAGWKCYVKYLLIKTRVFLFIFKFKRILLNEIIRSVCFGIL